MTDRSLQEIYAPTGRCFGCGVTNAAGLRIRSIALASTPDAHVVCDFVPARYHEAFEDVLNGGIIGTLLDCHMGWTAMFHLIQRDHLDHAPPCVTAELKVVFKRPTPIGPLHIDAFVTSAAADRVAIEATMTAAGHVTAIGTGTFIAVKPGHPAYHRW